MKRKIRILNQPTRLSDMQFDELDNTATSGDWELRAERLQARRWRKLRHEM